MPLLRRKPFVRAELPEDVDDDEELFYCELTNEVFRDYEEFCQRVILCNSLVWSCALTGKPQLTYQEALQSEENARALIKGFPKKLVVPLLYLANLTQRSSFGELIEDVFSFARDRYFIGEKIEVNTKGDSWCSGSILEVNSPTEKEISRFRSENRDYGSSNPPSQLYSYRVRKSDTSRDVIIAKGDKLRRSKGVYTREKNRLILKQFTEQNGKVWVVKDSILKKFNIHEINVDDIFSGHAPEFGVSKKVANMANVLPKAASKPQTNGLKKEKRQETIQKYFRSPGKTEVSPKKNTSPGKKDKKQSESPSGRQEKKTSMYGKKDGTGKKKLTEGPQKQLTMKRSPKKHDLDHLKSPQKQQLAKKLKDKYKDVNMKKKDAAKKLIQKHRINKTTSVKGMKERFTVEERRQKLKEEKKERAIEEKRKKVEERIKERAKIKEEKLKLAEFMKQWNRQREDLECEDLKELPVPREIQCEIPNEMFGDFVMILEFLHSFSEVLPVRDFFPGGVTFETLERAITVNEVAGPLSEILQLLLTTLFNMQEEEDDEVLETDNQITGVTDENGDITTSKAVKLATSAASWCQLYQGMPLSKVTLDSVTLTEVLRLHLLSSGGRAGEMSSKWRYQQRGGYTSFDDPGLILRIEQPHILRALSVMNVCDLPLADKLKIVSCLINQILTYATVRDVIDERGEKVKQLRAEIKSYQVAEIKKEREVAAMRMKEKKEAKKLKEEAAAAAAGGQNVTPPTEIQPEANSEDREVRRQRLDRESSRRKQEIQKKSRDLFNAVFGHQLLPIGFDRAYRRFWLFSSLPGLFVENDERWVGSCLPNPTPYNPALAKSEDTLTYIRKLFEEENGGGGSDKENDVGEESRPVATSSSNKKLLSEKNSSVPGSPVHVHSRSSVSDRTGWSASDKLEDSDKVNPSKQPLICTADNTTCPVHGASVERTTWAFFNKEEDINHLIECLNKRGIREGELRQALIQEKPQIVQNVANCPVHKLDKTQPQDNSVPETRKSSRSQKQEDANLNFPPGTPINEILELTLRDLILEMEEKMQLGGLGSLKVNSREEWRKALNSRSYDKQCDKLVWGIEKVKEEENQDVIPVEETNKERSNSPSNCEADMCYKDPGRLLDGGDMNDQQNPVVHSLACAILQIAQCVEKKYLQKPLGGEDGPSDHLVIKRWEESLMASTSLSQLFLHFSSLDNSIQWSRSALNAHCRLCRRRGDAENMLLCDGCNKGHHLYCLKPKLTKVPQGDWFCPKCRPPEKKSRASRARRLFSQESDEDETNKEKTLDTQCKTTEGKEACSTCGKGGQVICCLKCPNMFHMDCLVPPMRKAPRGRWYCLKCKTIKELSNVQNDADLQPTRRSGRRSLEVDLDLPLNNAVLQDLLTDIMHHKDSWPFLRPVQKAQVPDYHLIIKRPMDFGKMKYKLNMLEYRNNSEFIADALLIFENCQMYNQVDAQEYKAGVRLGKYFEKKCRELGLQLKEDELRPPEAKKPKLNM